MRDPDGMIRSSGNHLVDVGAKTQHLLPRITTPVQLHGDERGIFHVDLAAFSRCFQPITAV